MSAISHEDDDAWRVVSSIYLDYLIHLAPHPASTLICPLLFLEGNIKRRDQCLCQPEGEDQLGARHEQLGDQALEEGRGTLVARHVSQNAETALWVVKVTVLDTGLDDVKRSRHDERCRRTGDGGDKVLEPRRLVVVL